MTTTIECREPNPGSFTEHAVMEGSSLAVVSVERGAYSSHTFLPTHLSRKTVSSQRQFVSVGQRTKARCLPV
jgi:hypothetical protein